jgi:hypothetical protein
MRDAAQVEPRIIGAGVCWTAELITVTRERAFYLSIFKYLSIARLRYHRSSGSNTTTGDIICSSQ